MNSIDEWLIMCMDDFINLNMTAQSYKANKSQLLCLPEDCIKANCISSSDILCLSACRPRSLPLSLFLSWGRLVLAHLQRPFRTLGYGWLWGLFCYTFHSNLNREHHAWVQGGEWRKERRRTRKAAGDRCGAQQVVKLSRGCGREGPGGKRGLEWSIGCKVG